ncbi:MAG: TetR/AcrR family transcriptional regulator [Candidatus Gracilibacteria bacterium]|nr:TetR/AcrR family transcriptional regulator [Candidatus Gracilibacteria bacterium]
MRKTKEEQELTKKLLLEVASYLFEKEGYYHTSLDKIAQSAGVTRGAIYWNFSGKLELLEILLDQNYKKYAMMLEFEFGKTASAIQKLESIFELYFRLLQNDEAFRQVERLHFNEKFTGEEQEVLEKFSQHDVSALEKYVEEIYKEGILCLEFKNQFLPEVFSTSFVTFFFGIVTRFLPEDDFEESIKKSKSMLEVFLKGVG